MKATIRSLAMMLACLIIAACSSGADHASSTASAAPMELKVYSVPTARADAIKRSLEAALGVTTSANITEASPGRLLIYASRDTQASIGEAIAAMEKATPTAFNDKAGDQALQIRFWVIDALPGSGSGSDDPALKGLAPALASVRQSMGALHFRLNASAAAASSLGQKGQIQTNGNRGQDFNFASKPGRDGSVQLHVGYFDATQSGLTKLQTDLDVQLGHYIVLARCPALVRAPPPRATASSSRPVATRSPRCACWWCASTASRPLPERCRWLCARKRSEGSSGQVGVGVTGSDGSQTKGHWRRQTGRLSSQRPAADAGPQNQPHG